MIFRPDYIKAIVPFIDKPLVKILAGVRRCGKSTIFEMLKAELIDRGTEEARIIHRSYTDMDMPENITAKEMYAELTAAMQGKGRCYLLLDEIQEIKGWEKAVNSLLENTDADIYVTGSNSKLMSSEISTYLTGRYVTIPVYTLSFKEYIQGGERARRQGIAERIHTLWRVPYNGDSRIRGGSGVSDSERNILYRCFARYCKAPPHSKAGAF